MRKNSTYIVLFVALLVFGVVMFLFFGLENIKQGKYAATIVVGDNTVWTYNNKKWLNITNNASINKLNWKEFVVYSNNEKIGNYLLWHDDKWYAFDNERNAISIDGNFLAYNANYDMKVSNFSLDKVTDMTYVNDILRENNLSLSSQFTSLYKTDFDFDNDGIFEVFYLMSNAFPMDFDPEMIFSIAFMVKNDKIYYIYNDISSNRSFNGCKPYYNSFLDTNNDGVYEFILSCGRYSTSEQVDMLYQYKEDAFKIVISNQ